MNYFFEPINNIEWNLFEEINDVGFIDTYIGTKSMEMGDYLILYIGDQDPKVNPGVYAVAKIISKPYVFSDVRFINSHCYNRVSVDARITLLSKTKPLIVKSEMRKIVNQFRSAHKIDSSKYVYIKNLLDRKFELNSQDRLEQVMQRIDKFVNDRDWRKFHTPSNLAKSISIEANELLECFQWSDTDYDLEHVKEELADILNYCIQMSQVLNLDIVDIINAKMDKTEKKYPIDKAKGVSTKYDKL